MSQVPVSMKKAKEFCGGTGTPAWGPAQAVCCFREPADFVVETSLAPKCDALNLTAVCCGPTMSLKQIWIFLHPRSKVRQSLGCCVNSAHSQVN